MLKKFAVALVAASLIAGPAFAQGNNTAAPITAGQPAKADAKKDTKSSLNTRAVKKHVAHKHVAQKRVTKHHAKKVHVSKVKPVDHGKTVKRVKPAKNTAG